MHYRQTPATRAAGFFSQTHVGPEARWSCQARSIKEKGGSWIAKNIRNDPHCETHSASRCITISFALEWQAFTYISLSVSRLATTAISISQPTKRCVPKWSWLLPEKSAFKKTTLVMNLLTRFTLEEELHLYYHLTKFTGCYKLFMNFTLLRKMRRLPSRQIRMI